MVVRRQQSTQRLESRETGRVNQADQESIGKASAKQKEPKEVKVSDRFQFERGLLQSGVTRIAGVDEAGRGPLAGPVVAAAVAFCTEWILEGLPDKLRGLNDSKQLTEFQREQFFSVLVSDARVIYESANAGTKNPGRRRGFRVCWR